MIQRRAFITLLGGAAAWPIAAHAQRPAMPVIGLLSSRFPDESAHLVAAFHRGLSETGYADGKNVAIEYRWALGRYDYLSALAADLVRRPVTVIVTGGGSPTGLAAREATATIPIVFVMGADPVRLGLVASFNRPGGNVTGIYNATGELAAKRLELLHELLADTSVIAFLTNPTNPTNDLVVSEVDAAARSLRQGILILQASSERDIDAAFATLVQRGVRALVVSGDAFLISRRDQLLALAVRHAIPAIYDGREFAIGGGLMSYGTGLADAYRLAGTYTGRILKGEKPADLPVQQSTKVELIINLKTAKTLGLTFPLTLLGRADEVIE
jgi:putative ABC transport system substrate-binding protein